VKILFVKFPTLSRVKIRFAKFPTLSRVKILFAKFPTLSRVKVLWNKGRPDLLLWFEVAVEVLLFGNDVRGRALAVSIQGIEPGFLK
jgi:hypothetical protein